MTNKTFTCIYWHQCEPPNTVTVDAHTIEHAEAELWRDFKRVARFCNTQAPWRYVIAEEHIMGVYDPGSN